ncbi:hypothetical protein BBJ28_00000953 [Nothophytophthora sp. Chile5]|nr:hypothetical protein BBJ28_00000953 [Nothophytophthora sp. Chile5]
MAWTSAKRATASKGNADPKRKRVCVHWDADSVAADSPTSMDVLLRWLTTPGNYRRWESDSKRALSREIVVMLKEEGIMHRTPTGICRKIWTVVHAYATARSWLVSSGLHEAYGRGQVDQSVRDKVRQTCPRFDELAPTLQEVSFVRGDIDEDSDDDVEPARVCSSASPVVQYAVEANVPQIRSSAPSFVPPAVVQDAQSTPLQSGNDGGRAAVDAVARDEHAERLLECELAGKKAIVEYELEAKKIQLQIEMICQTALKRKKLLDAGLPREEVDRILPA